MRLGVGKVICPTILRKVQRVQLRALSTSTTSGGSFSFKVIHQSKKSRARVCQITTPHGVINTPMFVPVATNATLKGVDPVNTTSLGTSLMFCNTFHLLLHPGPDAVKAIGGLHKFMNYNFPLITDSGGFQVFSLQQKDPNNIELKGKGGKEYEGCVVSISEDGVVFKSYRDGQKIMLSPESSVAFQKDFGADIIIPFDELPAYSVSDEKLIASLERTHRWEARSLKAHRDNPLHQAMYSVIHGGVRKHLRKQSIDFLTKLPFDGHAIGGSVGKDRQEMYELLEWMMPLMPPDKPVHLLGIGDTEAIQRCVPYGIDTFDSAYPTRLGRHGTLFTKNGVMKLKRGIMMQNFGPIEPTCTCYTCKNYSVSYLHHLLKAHEIAFEYLGTLHNLHFMVQMMEDIRNKILNDEI